MDGKVIAITGGASGIGLATAQILSKRGATVCIGDLDPEALKKTDEYFANEKAKYSIHKLDVSNSQEVDAWFADIKSKHGRLDGAANVAGITGGRIHGQVKVEDMPNEEWQKILDVNLNGTMYCMRAELKLIPDGGSIVNVASIHGLKGFAKFSAYDASKWAVIGLTKAAALEYGDREIRINAVAPGAIYTPLMQKNWDMVGRPKDAPFGDPSAFQRQGTAAEVGHIIAFLLGPDSTFVSGSVYSVDGGWL